MKKISIIALLLFKSLSTYAEWPSYNIVSLGLTGSVFQKTDGSISSNAYVLNASGDVIGTSKRYGSNNADLGKSAWIYKNGLTQELGLSGVNYQTAAGYKNSSVGYLNEVGQATGSSDRVSSGGRSVWLFDGNSTIELGLSGSKYQVSGTGSRYTYGGLLNNSGQVAGTSCEYPNAYGNCEGNAAWRYSNGVTEEIGIRGAGYENILYGKTYRQSTVSAINSSGQIVGTSTRYKVGPYNTYSSNGSSAWIQTGSTTTEIGLSTQDYFKTRSTVSIADINDAGYVVGSTSRDANSGVSSWIYNGTSTAEIGLVGNDFVKANGYKYSYVQDKNQ